MKASQYFQSCGIHFFSRSKTSITLSRPELKLSQKSFISLAKHAEEEINGSVSLSIISPTLLAAEKEEAKAVLTLFLKRQGSSNAVAARIINKSDALVDNLVSHLHSVYKARYLVGRELTTLEIREALVPYLEALHDEYGSNLVDIFESFPILSLVKDKVEENIEKQPVLANLTPIASLDSKSKKQKALARVNSDDPTSKLPPHITYLLELGMDLEAIKEVIRKFPAFAYYSLDGKIKPAIEYLMSLGISKEDIPTIISKRPQLCGISLTENLIPTMAFLEDLGVDKTQWAKVIYRFPPLLTYSRQKLKSSVEFLYEMGLSSDHVSKVLTRCPNIISYSVENKLRPVSEYFKSLDVDVSVILYRSPQTFGLSIDDNLKPVTEFFLEKGFSYEEIATMTSRYGALYTFSLSDNLMVKWEFFLTMVYPRTELVKFPQYFGYSFEDRIKPRYETMKNCGIKLLLNQMLSLSSDDFLALLNKKMKKKNLN